VTYAKKNVALWIANGFQVEMSTIESDDEVVALVSPEKRKRGMVDDPDAEAAVKKPKACAYSLTVTVWNPEATIDALTNKFRNELVHSGCDGFSRVLVPYVMEKAPGAIVSVTGGLGRAAALWGLGLEGVIQPSTDDFLNPMMSTLFGSLFAEVGVSSVLGLNDFLVPSADPSSGGFEPSPRPGNLLCTFIPCVNNMPSAAKNNVNQPEFLEGSNVNSIIYNDKFWNSHKMFRNLKAGGKFQLMEMALKVPEFLLKTNQIGPHREAVTWLNNYGCGLGGDFVKMTVYKSYVSVLISFLNSPIVKKARIYGFFPLFLIKNCLLQKTNFGKKNMQFATIDKDAKTSILLAGFWTMKHNNRDKLAVVALGADGSFLTHSTVFD